MTDRNDTYTNAMTGLGSGIDKSLAGGVAPAVRLSSSELESLYEGDGTAAKIVDTVVDDALEEGFTVESEDIDWPELRAAMRKAKTFESLGDLWRWARLYGGALAIPLIETRSSMDTPLTLQAVKALRGWNIVPSPWAYPEAHGAGLLGGNFSKPARYRIGVPHGSEDRQQAKTSPTAIHWTRVIRVDGCRVSPYSLTRREGWGPSVLDRVYDSLRALGSAMGYAENILHEISMLALKLHGFRDAMSGGKESQDEVAETLANIKQNLDLLHVLGLDKEDELVEVSRNVSGLEALINKFEDALVRDSGIPRALLLEQSPAGMNANGGHERREWNKRVAKKRGIFLLPAIEQAVRFHLAAMEIDPDAAEFEIKFPPVDTPTPQEAAATDHAQAQADQIWYNIRAMSAEEIRERKIADGSLVAIGDGPEPGTPPEAPGNGGDDEGQPDPGDEESPGEETPEAEQV